jgi:hypothetical protein
MSTYPSPSPIEEKRPGFLRRPVPMWAFLLLVVIIGIIIFLPALLPFTSTPIKEPLILTPDSRTFNITGTQSINANFTVANLNTTSTIAATVTIVLVPTTPHVNATIYGVQTGDSFVAATNGRSVSFLPGGNTLILHVISDSGARGNYTVHVSLSG